MSACSTISCKCKEVVIDVPAPPFQSLQCVCVDCRRCYKWCEEKGGQSPPLVSTAVYFPNALKVRKGMDRLKCYKLKEGYDTYRIVTDCCWTQILSDHPMYEGLRFSCFPPTCDLKLQDNAEIPPVEGRYFLDDRTEEELATFPPMPEFHGTPAVMPTKEEVETLLAGGKYITIQTLMESLGGVQYMDPDYVGPATIWTKMLKEKSGE